MDAWILNLDAELELATLGPYTPTRAVERAVETQQRSAAALMAPDDRLVAMKGEPSPPDARGLLGRAWCMTPRARRRLIEAGAVPVDSPSVEVLRRVNGRAFAASLGPTLPGGAMVDDLETLREKVMGQSPGGIWLAKRELAMAGRGQRRIESGPLEEVDLRWARASLRSFPLRLEPWVEIELELAVHGWVEPDGRGWRGPLCVQRCDARGAWMETRAPEPLELDAAFIGQVQGEARRVAEALHQAGYFGPFGVDAFLYRDGAGSLRLNPRSEINARYTMGWSVARDAGGD